MRRKSQYVYRQAGKSFEAENISLFEGIKAAFEERGSVESLGGETGGKETTGET